MSELNPHAANLLKAEYGPHAAAHPLAAVSPTTVGVPTPSADLVHQLEGTAQTDFGIPVGAVADWSTWITSLVTAIAAQNWLALIPLVLQLGSYIPQAWAFIQALIKQLHGGAVLPPTGGPVITGS